MRFPLLRALPALFLVSLAVGGCGGGIAAEPTDGGAGETAVVIDTGTRSDDARIPTPRDATPDPDDAPPVPSDAIIVEDDGPVPPGGCNTLENTAPTVSGTTVDGVAPAATGGTIVPGRYHLTAATFYRTSGAALPPFSVQITFQLASGTINTVSKSSGEVDRSTSTFTLSGTTLNLSQSCPDAKTQMMQYTATPTSVVFNFPIMESGISGVLRYTLTKI